MKRCLVAVLVPALLAAAPSPLVVGSVRDQYGLPIRGARVNGGSSVTRTDAQGTFALRGANVRSVVISCAYCERLTVRVAPNEPVVALVRRYDRIAQDAPSERDIASVPYARVESIASLRPFTVLENSSHALAGAQVSDRGASPRGALVLDDGIPVYDITVNRSPFVVFPDYAAQRLAWRSPSDAFSYGDLAGGGTLMVQTRGEGRWSGVLAGADTTALRAGETRDGAAWSAASSHDPGETRNRGDAFLRIPFGEDALSVTASASGDRYRASGQRLDTSEGGVRVAYDRFEQNHVSASIVADGGGYGGGIQGSTYSSTWSDVQVQAGVATSGRIEFFTDAGMRVTSGAYAASAVPATSGVVTQTRAGIGAQTSGENYAVRAGLGAFDFAYSGGAGGTRSSLTGGILAPGVSGTYRLDPHWTLQLQAGESFALPTLLEAFTSPAETPALNLDRNSLAIATLGYGDLHRFRAALTAMSEGVSGLNRGTIHSAGVSAAWQIAPALTLRAWLLHENDATQPYEPAYGSGVDTRPATVGSYWLTYATAGLRIDALYRRDLLDYRVDPHLDASISAPVSRGIRFFAATRRRAGIREVTIGLRESSQ